MLFINSDSENNLIVTKKGSNETYKLGEILEILNYGNESQTVLIKSEHPEYSGSISYLDIYWNKRDPTYARTLYEFSSNYNYNNFTNYAKYFATNTNNEVFVSSESKIDSSETANSYGAIEFFTVCGRNQYYDSKTCKSCNQTNQVSYNSTYCTD